MSQKVKFKYGLSTIPYEKGSILFEKDTKSISVDSVDGRINISNLTNVVYNQDVEGSYKIGTLTVNDDSYDILGRDSIYTPSVDNGVLSWTNNAGLENPDPVNINGSSIHTIEFNSNSNTTEFSKNLFTDAKIKDIVISNEYIYQIVGETSYSYIVDFVGHVSSVAIQEDEPTDGSKIWINPNGESIDIISRVDDLNLALENKANTDDVYSKTESDNRYVLKNKFELITVDETGFYVVDSDNNILLKYDENGLDAHKFSNHFISLILAAVNNN